MYRGWSFLLFAAFFIFQEGDTCSDGKYQKRGCYQESVKGVTLFNDRDNIDWQNFPTYAKGLVCSCEKAAKSSGYYYFAIRFYGICVGLNVANDGLGNALTNGKCKNSDFKNCDDFSKNDCVGADNNDYVYLVGTDGGYGQWTLWSSCSVSCGSGAVGRRRECDSPVKIGNGNTCDVLGPHTETNTCNRSPCQSKVDGKFGQWSSFTSCTKSCGGGVHERTRKCDSPSPSGGGKDCNGVTKEIVSCSTKPCPVDGGFGSWSSFSGCTKTCGGGTKTRTRKCDSPPPSNGGKYCQGTEYEFKKCNENGCSVDGGFGSWSSFGSCSKPCGSGLTTRTRKCNSPPPSNGGKYCQGKEYEAKSCNTHGCKVDGGFGSWSSFSSCSKTCGSGITTRTRRCDSPPTSNGGKYCQGKEYETKGCNTQSCAVDGNYGSWSSYGACSVTCGGGLQYRKRNCDSPKPSNGGANCKGSASQSRTCATNKCPVVRVDGKYGQWSSYGACSQTCGGGSQFRTRRCDSPPPANGGSYCNGLPMESRFCNANGCAVDGGFGAWSSFSGCTKTCGGGTTTRTRKCDSPSPSKGGKYCQGKEFEQQQCNIQTCKVDGGFGSWSSFSSCTKTCGGGTATRRRKCDSPAPSNGGRNCQGHTFEVNKCNQHQCQKLPVDGGFSEWTNFSPCSRTCGGGEQLRQRDCNNPKPQNGGKNCVGPREQRNGCRNDFCKGTEGVTKAQVLVEEFLKNFHNKTYPGQKPSGKFIKAIFEIQKVIAKEFVSVDPTTRKDLDALLKELEKMLIVATKGGSIDFARTTLGKSILAFIKKKIGEGLPIDDLDKASQGYLEWLKTQIGEEKFTKIISSQGESTLMFAMDTTASMKEEINAAKGIAKAIIEETRDFGVDYILSPFNDPKIGPVIYKTDKQRAEVVDAVSRIRIHGGGDCPERTFGGMLAALNKGPNYGSPMFVFTDASAKDATPGNMNALKAAAMSSATSIYFFANPAGCKGSGIESFKEIASATSGQIFPLKNDNEILKFTKYVKSSLQQDTLIATGGTLHSTTGKRSLWSGTRKHTFNVDDGIKKLIVIVSTSIESTAQYVKLVRESDGAQWTATVSISMAVVFEVSREVATSFVGKWSLTFPPTVGDYKYNIQAVSSDPVEFAYSFVYQQSPSKNSPAYTFNDPVKGQSNKMVIRIGGDNINRKFLNCELVGVEGGSLQRLSLTQMEVDVYYTMITPPDAPFKVKCSGQTKKGSSFERMSSGISKAKTTFMRPLYAGDMFTVPVTRGGVVADAQVQVFNMAATENINFDVRTTHGRVTFANKVISIRKMGFFSFKYHGPTDSTLKGRTDHITITAQRTTSGETFTTTFSVLLT